MPRYRRDITEDKEQEIRQYIQNGGSIGNAALKFDISFTLARQIKNNSRVRPPAVPEGKGVAGEGVEMCTACGTRPKAPGNRYLCTVCHSNW